MRTNIPIVFTIDNSYVKQLSTVICSIIYNKKADTHYDFFVLNKDIQKENKDTLLNFIYELDNKSSLCFMNIRDYSADLEFEKYMSRRDNYSYISIETYFRFFILKIFKQYIKIIYLDSDVLVLGDLKELYDINIDGYYAGVVEDITQKYLISNKNVIPIDKKYKSYEEYYTKKLKKKTSLYFNAGVLLLNIQELNKDNVFDKLWEFTIKESPLELQDQDVLNSILESKIKYLDYKWNVPKDIISFVNENNIFNNLHMLETSIKPAIIHYIGSNKPWIFSLKDNYSYLFIQKWWNFYMKTPFFNEKELKILNLIYKHRCKESYKILCITFMNFNILSFFIVKNRLKLNFFNIIKPSLKIYRAKRLSISQDGS